MDPILHLSLAVRDLAESRAFYVDVLGCEPGRVRDGWIDVWFYGMQVTLHEEPELVAPPDARGVRHFGVTLAADQLDAVLHRLESSPRPRRSNGCGPWPRISRARRERRPRR